MLFPPAHMNGLLFGTQCIRYIDFGVRWRQQAAVMGEYESSEIPANKETPNQSVK